MPTTSYRSGDVTAISPGFHGRSLLTRQLGQLTRQILSVAGAAPVGSMALNLARGYTVMTVVTPPRSPSSSAPSGNLPAIVATILATS
jgi:P-type Ca2+ transporter type 2C